jgi:hypothetical protein
MVLTYITNFLTDPRLRRRVLYQRSGIRMKEAGQTGNIRLCGTASRSLVCAFIPYAMVCFRYEIGGRRLV